LTTCRSSRRSKKGLPTVLLGLCVLAAPKRELGEVDKRSRKRSSPTGVVAKLLAERPRKVLALWADIDALPIQEETELPSLRPTQG
jgi:metal-dependent amidase/aminoacylase/carboxypeptidase family protein